MNLWFTIPRSRYFVQRIVVIHHHLRDAHLGRQEGLAALAEALPPSGGAFGAWTWEPWIRGVNRQTQKGYFFDAIETIAMTDPCMYMYMYGIWMDTFTINMYIYIYDNIYIYINIPQMLYMDPMGYSKLWLYRRVGGIVPRCWWTLCNGKFGRANISHETMFVFFFPGTPSPESPWIFMVKIHETNPLNGATPIFCYAGFLSHGATPSSHPFWLIGLSVINHPLLGTSIYGNLHL